MNIAQQFLVAIGGKNAIQYQWICNGTEDIAKMLSALPQAPLCPAPADAPGWNNVEPPIPTDSTPSHSTMLYGFQGQNALIYDLSASTEDSSGRGLAIPYALQGIVSVNPPPPAPVLPPTPTEEQEETWLQQVVDWLQNKIVPLFGNFLKAIQRSNVE